MPTYAVVLHLVANDSDELMARMYGWSLSEGELVQSIREHHEFVPVPADLASLAPSGPLQGPPEPVPLAAAFTFIPASPAIGAAVSFNASASSGAIATYGWDYGDGGTAADGGAIPTHAYTKKGTYTVALVVTDADGNTATSNQPITIQ